MRVLFLALIAALWAASPATAQQINLYCATGTGAFTTWQPASAANPCPVTASISAVTGAISNASSAVATSSTNLGTVAYNYGFNGATWDQLQVDGSKFLKVVNQTGSTTAITAASGAIASGAVASGAIASGAFASGAIGSGAIASGAVASGAYASGAFASGAFASGSYASGSQAVGITPTDRTITSATGSSQTAMASNAARKGMIIVNTGNANCGVNPTGGTAAIGGAGTLTLVPMGSYTPRIPTLAAVTVICTAGQPLYADEN